MKLNERIALAKAGYKKADIEKMLDVEEVKEENEEDKEVVEEVTTEDNTEDNTEDKQLDNEEDTIVEDTIKDNIIEELQGKVLDLERQLKNAQANNINTNRIIENPIEKAEKKLYDTIANFS